jgi:hypothetical protein
MLDLQSMARALGGDVSRDQVLAPGPGHSAGDRSLSLKLDAAAPDGFLIHSFSGDDPIVCRDHVRTKCGLPEFRPNGGRRPRRSSDEVAQLLRAAVRSQQREQPQGRVVAAYRYTDANGALQYEVLRYEPKTFRQRRPDGAGGWIPNLDGICRVPYRLQELLRYPDATVFVCEGEKDADRIALLGQCATTVASGKWTDDCVKALAGRDVMILEDNDEAGRKKAAEAAAMLYGVATTVRVARLPGLGEGGDVSDWLDGGHNADQLVEQCFAAPVWVPAPSSAPHESENAKTNESNGAKNNSGQQQQSQTAKPLIKRSKDFVAGFVPPDYSIVGLLIRRFLYSFTGATGAGKTAIMLLLAASVALGIPFAGRITKKTRVLYAAAENPDDVRMRWIALAEVMNFDIDTIEVYFTEGRFNILEMSSKLRADAESCGGEFGLVIVDTSPAFFLGDDENNRKQMGAHGYMLRGLIDTVPGGPTVVAACHPVKNATADNLLPAGGGTFLNEVDGNLTAAKNDSIVEMHWQGKFRGPEFAPMNFLIKTVTHPSVKDSDGRLIPTVLAQWIDEQGREDIQAAARNDEDAVVEVIRNNPSATLTSVARAMDWKLHGGEPNKMRAKRCIDNLKKHKLIKETRTGNFRVIKKQKKEDTEEE